MISGPRAAVPVSTKGVRLVHDILLHRLRRISVEMFPFESGRMLQLLLATPSDDADRRTRSGGRPVGQTQWGLPKATGDNLPLRQRNDMQDPLWQRDPRKVTLDADVAVGSSHFFHALLISCHLLPVRPLPSQHPRSRMLTFSFPPDWQEIAAVELIINSIGSGISGFNRYLPALSALLMFLIGLSDISFDTAPATMKISAWLLRLREQLMTAIAVPLGIWDASVAASTTAHSVATVDSVAGIPPLSRGLPGPVLAAASLPQPRVDTTPPRKPAWLIPLESLPDSVETLDAVNACMNDREPASLYAQRLLASARGETDFESQVVLGTCLRYPDVRGQWLALAAAWALESPDTVNARHSLQVTLARLPSVASSILWCRAAISPYCSFLLPTLSTGPSLAQTHLEHDCLRRRQRRPCGYRTDSPLLSTWP